METSSGTGTGTVAVSAEGRFQRTPDGAVWTVDGLAHAFWARYLSAFDRVRVIARVTDVQDRPPAATRVNGLGVEIWPLSCHPSTSRWLIGVLALRRSLRAAVRDVDVVILRVPSPIAAVLAVVLDRGGRRYAVEVLGDPPPARGMIRYPWRPLLRWWSVRRLRQQCRQALGAAYSAGVALQARYPAGPTAVISSFPSVDLPPEAFVPMVRPPGTPGTPVTLICVGSLDDMLDGVDTLLAALRRLVTDGLPVGLIYVGDGRLRARMVRLVERLGLVDRVTITGVLSPAEVRQRLGAADLFVCPARVKEPPRALLEAMACGLPVVGTTVAGLDGLLNADCLVPAGNPAVLAETIRDLLGDQDRMSAEAGHNLARAREFRTEILAPRRATYYRTIRVSAERLTRGADQTGPVNEAPTRVGSGAA